MIRQALCRHLVAPGALCRYRRRLSSLSSLVAGEVLAALSSSGHFARDAAPATNAHVTVSRRADYQTSVPLQLSGDLPDASALAASLAEALNARASGGLRSPIASAVASRGFINLTLSDAFLASRVHPEALAAPLNEAAAVEGGATPSGQRLVSARPLRRALVDFSSPNMGKELHVGHLRSAVIGDTLARALLAPSPTRGGGANGSGAVSEGGGVPVEGVAGSMSAPFDVVERISHAGDAGLPVAIVLAAYRLGAAGGVRVIRDASPAEMSAVYEVAKKTMDGGGGGDALSASAPPSPAAQPNLSISFLEEAAAEAVRQQHALEGTAMSTERRLEPPHVLSQLDPPLLLEDAKPESPDLAAAAVAPLPRRSAKKTKPSSGAANPALPSSPSPEQQAQPPPKKRTAFAEYVHATLRLLQSALAKADAPAAELGVEERSILAQWADVCDASRAGYKPLLDRLGVRVREVGESAYASRCAPLVASLLRSGHAVALAGGAVGIFSEGAGRPPVLLRKADGAFLYATVDLVALRARIAAGFERIVYVTDVAQAGHFRALFAAAVACGWVEPAAATSAGGKGSGAAASAAAAASPVTSSPSSPVTLRGRVLIPLDPSAAELPASPAAPRFVTLEHAHFGLVTGEGGRRLSSRDGTSECTLRGLLDEGVERALRETRSKGAEEGAKENVATAADPPPAIEEGTSGAPAVLPLRLEGARRDARPEEVAEAIATSAIRYFDLAHNRRSDYGFSYERALALKGNTAPYILYATTRLAALRRQAQDAGITTEWQAPPQPRGAPGADTEWGRIVAFLRLAVASLGDDLLLGAQHLEGGAAAGQRDREIALADASERTLALHILRLDDAVAHTRETLAPNVLTDFLYDGATLFHAFYERCRIVPPREAVREAQAAILEQQRRRRNAARGVLCAAGAAAAAEPPFPSASTDVPALRAAMEVALSRILLCQAADRALRRGLDLVGLPVVERM